MNQRDHRFLESDSKELCLHGVLGNETTLPRSLHGCRVVEIQLTPLVWERASLLLTAQACESPAGWADWGICSTKGLPSRLGMSLFFRRAPPIHCFYINFNSSSARRTAFTVRKCPTLGAFVQSQDYLCLTRSVFASGMRSLVWPLWSPATWMCEVRWAAAAGTLGEPGVHVCCLESGMMPSENTYWRQPEWADLYLCGLCLQTA